MAINFLLPGGLTVSLYSLITVNNPEDYTLSISLTQSITNIEHYKIYSIFFFFSIVLLECCEYSWVTKVSSLEKSYIFIFFRFFAE